MKKELRLPLWETELFYVIYNAKGSVLPLHHLGDKDGHIVGVGQVFHSGGKNGVGVLLQVALRRL